MKINCYAVFDAKIADYQLAIFDIKDEGAIRQFYDVLSDSNHRWSKHPEDYSLWSVVRSISASHKMIVQWAKDNNMESVTIGEQDLMFTAPDAWDYYLKQMPQSFDVYLGCSYVSNELLLRLFSTRI